MAKSSFLKPTESELEILQVLWQKKEATVREVHEALKDLKDAGYTTTLKLMQIMHEKGLVTRDDSSKTHVYKAGVSKDKTQQHLAGRMVNTLFGGSASQLMMQVFGNKKPSAKEIAEIQQLLDELK